MLDQIQCPLLRIYASALQQIAQEVFLRGLG